MLVTYVNYYLKNPQEFAFRSLLQPGPGRAGQGPGDLLTLPYPQSVDVFIGDKLACFALENTFMNIKEKTGMIG